MSSPFVEWGLAWSGFWGQVTESLVLDVTVRAPGLHQEEGFGWLRPCA